MNPINFYYVRNRSNCPVACIAITELPDHSIARGVSICSTSDKFSKPIARKIASHRLQCAISQKSNSKFGRYAGREFKSHRPTDSHGPEFKFKMAYGVEPTLFESRILHKPEGDF